jgi:hypothetical protein
MSDTNNRRRTLAGSRAVSPGSSFELDLQLVYAIKSLTPELQRFAMRVMRRMRETGESPEEAADALRRGRHLALVEGGL